LLTGINFSLTKFPDGCQTLKNEENEFLEFDFLKTNKVLVDIAIETWNKYIHLKTQARAIYLKKPI